MELNPGGGGGNGDPPPVLSPDQWISCALDLTRLPPVGSKVIYFPQGHFEQWAEHLVPPPAGHRPSFLCTVTSVEVFTAAHAPYARVSLTPAPNNDAPAPAAAVLNPRPTTTFFYNIKQFNLTDQRSLLVIPKLIHDIVLPKHGAGLTTQELQMVDIRGQRWRFTHTKSEAEAVHNLKGDWLPFVTHKGATLRDKVYFLRGGDGRLVIEVRKDPNKAAAERLAAPPPNLGQEITQASDLSSHGMEFTATYYPHKAIGKFVVSLREVEEAMDIEWEAGMEVRKRKDVLQHTTEALYCSQTVTGTVRVVTGTTWRGLEVEWNDSTTSTVSAWEVDIVGSPPRKKRKIDVDVAGPSKKPAVVFGVDLAAA